MNPVKISEIPIMSSLFDILACVKACIESSMTLNSSAELVKEERKKSLWISVVSQSLNFLPIYFKACDPEHGFVRFHWSSIICFSSLQVFIASIKDLKRGLPAFRHAITNRASGKKKHANPVCNEKPLQFPWAYNQFVNHIRRIRNNISKA